MRWLPKPALPRVDFEFQPHTGRIRAAAWILWIAAIAFTADVAWSYVTTREALYARTQELSVAPAGAHAVSKKTYQPRNVDLEIDFARATVQKIALPWGDLFRELGASAVDGVSLLGVQPDPERGTLQISAQAENIAAMLTYLARLESNKFFPTVALVRHEIKRDETRRPVFFLVVATWKNRR